MIIASQNEDSIGSVCFTLCKYKGIILAAQGFQATTRFGHQPTTIGSSNSCPVLPWPSPEPIEIDSWNSSVDLPQPRTLTFTLDSLLYHPPAAKPLLLHPSHHDREASSSCIIHYNVLNSSRLTSHQYVTLTNSLLQALAVARTRSLQHDIP